MRRRQFLVGIGAIAICPGAARAQQAGRTYRVAVLTSVSEPPNPFFDELKRGGFEEGRNLVIDRRGVGVEIAQFDAVAADMVKAGPDVIAGWGAAAGHAAQRATKSIPIVVYSDDPVESHLVASMAAPGGNTTGVGIFAAQLDAKRLEILHELVPAARRIGILADPTQIGRAQVEARARELGLELVTREVRSTDGIVDAIDTLAVAKVDAINILASAVFMAGRELIIDRLRTLRLPAVYWWPDLAREGGLVGFGPTLDECGRLQARQVLRILKGAAPAELPVMQPTRFELVVNLKTAKELGIEIPGSLLARADEVIE